MAEGLAKSIGGKVISAVLAVGAIIIVIWYWRLPPEAREALWDSTRSVLIWVGFVAILPWALFFVPPKVVKADSNLAAAVMLAAYLIVDAVFALYLTGGQLGGAWQKGVMLFGLLVAFTYNFSPAR